MLLDQRLPEGHGDAIAAGWRRVVVDGAGARRRGPGPRPGADRGRAARGGLRARLPGAERAAHRRGAGPRCALRRARPRPRQGARGRDLPADDPPYRGAGRGVGSGPGERRRVRAARPARRGGDPPGPGVPPRSPGHPRDGGQGGPRAGPRRGGRPLPESSGRGAARRAEGHDHPLRPPVHVDRGRRPGRAATEDPAAARVRVGHQLAAAGRRGAVGSVGRRRRAPPRSADRDRSGSAASSTTARRPTPFPASSRWRRRSLPSW